MTSKEVYRIWAPQGIKWTGWVRPVPFIEAGEAFKQYHVSFSDFPGVDVSADTYRDAALIVDLPGMDSVAYGIELAKKGYRPVPIFNGVMEQENARAIVDNQSVMFALINGAEELAEIEIDKEAPPAFLLDSNRLHRHRIDVSIFDNSWDIYMQDMPSADFLIKNGIRKVIVIGDSVGKDLKKILYPYQKKKIEIYKKKEFEEPRRIKLRKPWNMDNL